MANFSALKTAIQNAIKQNGNEEITGDVLQQILLSIVSTMGDGAINMIEQNLSNEATTRQSADTQLNNLITGIKNNIDNGYVYGGIATPSSTPVSGKVFYIATAAGTYTNFGGQVLTQGINILRYNGSAWSHQQVIGIDDVPTAGSKNLAESGGVAETTILPVITYQQTYVNEDGVVNHTASLYHMTTEYVLAKEGIIISGIQRYTTGGYNLKLCFYDKYRNFISYISGEDDSDVELTNENIPSNAVYFIANLNIDNGVIYSRYRINDVHYIDDRANPNIPIIANTYLDADGNIVSTPVSSFATTEFYYATKGVIVDGCHPASSSDYTYMCFYDKDKNFLSALKSNSSYLLKHAIDTSEIPQGALYFKVCINPEYASIFVPQNDVFSKMISDINSVKTNIEVENGNKFINQYGEVKSTTVTSFVVTKPIIPKVGMVLHDTHPSSAVWGLTVAAFYDVGGLCVGTISGDGTNPYTKTLQASDIPNDCAFMRVSLYPNTGHIENYDYYVTDIKERMISDSLYEKMSFPIKNSSSNCYLSADGKIVQTTATNFLVTDFCPAIENIKIVSPHRASSDVAANTIICFYDNNFKFISNITTTDATLSSYTLTANNIPVNAAYFRATVWDYGYVNYRVPVNIVLKNIGIRTTSYFDYNTALSMDRNDLVEVIEAASNGRCTALYDDDGYPSLMYKIPKVAIGALAPALGDLNTVHPAFIVGGVEKDYIYVSVFETSLYDGHYVSWFGLGPVGHIIIPNLRTSISNKGDGWHLETIYEHSLIVLLTNLLNSPTPTGNTANGMSHVKPWEYCQREGGYIPGIPSKTAVGHTGLPYINGTQPSAWSHNKEQWGIQDVIGGFHRICDLYKLINGKIYLAADNRFFKKGDDISTFENSWIDTGAAFDYINDNIVLNTSVTNPMTVQYYKLKKYPEIRCTSDYDTLSLDLRKKLALLLLCSRISSSDTDPVFGFNGRFGIANHKSLCYGVFGGAQEYPGEVTQSDNDISGLGTQITAYPIDDNELEGHDAHYNMGSRIVYIE